MGLEALDPEEGFTTIQVVGDDFRRAALEKNKIFLETTPIGEFSGVEIHPGQSDCVYFRGIRAMKLDKKSAFTYNIKTEIELTEDRTIKYNYHQTYWIEGAIQDLTDPKLIEAIICSDKFYEDSLSYNRQTEEFSEIVMEIANRRGIASVNLSALTEAEKNLRRTASTVEIPLSAYEKGQIQEALAFLKEIGFEVIAPIIVSQSLGTSIYGLARFGTIYIAKETLDRGGNWLAGTILEEHLHITKGFLDESRDFQNYLLDLVMKFAREARFNKETQFLELRPSPEDAFADEIPF